MDDDKIKAMMTHTLAIEEMLVDISVAVRDEHGDDVATSVLINVATGLLAEVLHMAPPAVFTQMWEAITQQIGVKIGGMRVARDADKAADAAIIRAMTGDMTCYPDKPKKH